MGQDGLNRCYSWSDRIEEAGWFTRKREKSAPVTRKDRTTEAFPKPTTLLLHQL
jgi:hypothetical protein